MSMSFACASHTSDPLAAFTFHLEGGWDVLMLVVVDSNVLEERKTKSAWMGGRDRKV